MAVDYSILTRLGIEDILLWLLSFAIIYGITSTAKVPKNSAARALISISLSLLILFAVPSGLINLISSLGKELLILILGLMILIVFLEITGLTKFTVGAGKYGPQVQEHVFRTHEKYWLFAFFLIALFVFISIGGPAYIGIPNLLQNVNLVGLLFFVIITILVLYTILEKEK
ncbi:MAG: hypothetical protein KQA40_02575 [Candidatus Aenigmarchaeota archaeon]|nr:hypothetical protein [Candidatus Aenigmarchaeota archaeon]